MTRVAKVILLITPPSAPGSEGGSVPEKVESLVGGVRRRKATCTKLARLFGVSVGAVVGAVGGGS